MDSKGRIYAVNDEEANLRINSVAIERETDRLIVLTEYLRIPGRGFVRQLKRDTDKICRTPLGALKAYIAVQRQKAESLRTELGWVESRIMEATMMLEEAEEGAVTIVCGGGVAWCNAEPLQCQTCQNPLCAQHGHAEKDWRRCGDMFWEQQGGTHV